MTYSKNLIYKLFSILIALNLFLDASEYYSKIEPYEIYNIKSQLSGKIQYVNKKSEATYVKNTTIVQINSDVDKIELKQTKNKLSTFKQIIELEQGTLYKFSKIRAKSQLDKDNQKIKVLNLENQKSDLITKIAFLEDKINNKKLTVKNKYISSINVNVGDFVGVGTLLYTALDLNRGKLTIYIPVDMASDIKKQTIYLDGKKTDYKISKLYKVADTKHISSYKCEILINKPKNFSHLMKIEFK